MPMRVTGLTSGLDTESIISALVSSYSAKTDKYTKAQTRLSWTQETWKGLNTKVYSMYTNLSNLRFSTAYTTKKATVSDAAKASVSASGEAVVGTQKLKINSTAQSAYMTGGKIALVDKTSEEGLKGDTTLAELGYFGGKSSFSVRVNGENKNIEVDGSTTITDVVASLKEAGLNVNFDTAQSRLYVSAKASGKAGDFSIEPKANLVDWEGSPMQYDSDSYSALYALGLASGEHASKVYNSVASEDVQMITSHSGSKVNIHFETPDSKEAAAEQNALIQALKGSGELDEDSLSVISDSYKVTVNEQDDGTLTASYALDGYVFKDGNIYKEEDTAFSNAIASYEEKGTLMAWAEDVPDTVWVEGGSTASYVSRGTASSDITVDTTNTGSSLLFHFEEPTSAKGAYLQNRLKDSIYTNGDLVIRTGEADADGNVTASYTNPYFVFKDGKVYETADTEFANPVASYEERGTLIAGKYDQKASLTVAGGSTAGYIDEGDSDRMPTKIDGRDASIVLNGVAYTSSNNDFSINGLGIKAMAVTAEEITITTDVDTQALYDKIKDFLTEYNSLINEMNKMYNAESSYGYEPLTDEEKDAMSDTEIEKWETKIKDSLLRNDTTLNGVMMTMINAMSSSYEVNGKTYSLSSFGISTLGYLNAAKNEEYAYHIDGDADDENTSGKEDKLMEALREDPDSVIELMKQLTGRMYTALGDRMKSTSLSSAYTIYNDKEMSSQYTEYTKLISDWQKKVTEKEDYYYNKFSKMEAAMTKLQSQTSSLTGMFGS